MKTSFVALTLLAGTLCVPVAVLADNDTAHPGEYVKDSAVTVAVKSKLAAAHVSSLTNIHVDTDNNGVVWLKGSVGTQAEADRAVALARETDNVKAVHSDLKVKP
jgi:hyperosmotically inducible protein